MKDKNNLEPSDYKTWVDITLNNDNSFMVDSDNKIDLIDHDKTESKLKALEIIKKKRVDTRWLIDTNSLKEYNQIFKGTSEEHNQITKNEYNLLKEVLK